jgi:hypothetical protein
VLGQQHRLDLGLLVVEVRHGDVPEPLDRRQRGARLADVGGPREPLHGGAGLVERGGHRLVLLVHRRDRVAGDPHRDQCGPRDRVLVGVVVVQLVREVRPRGVQLLGALGVTGWERAERVDEAAEVTAYGAVDRLVHAHLGHAPTLGETPGRRQGSRPDLARRTDPPTAGVTGW